MSAIRLGDSVECPEIIEDYNNFMGGVDVSDQYMCYYSVGRKTMKWWRHVFWGLHDIAILNAFIIYCANHATSLQKIQSNKKFWIELARMPVVKFSCL